MIVRCRIGLHVYRVDGDSYVCEACGKTVEMYSEDARRGLLTGAEARLEQRAKAAIVYEAGGAALDGREVPPRGEDESWDETCHGRDVLELLATAAALRAALAQAIQVIEWCGANDKTPRYDYREARSDGTLPGPGKAFNTPRELARYWRDVLREALRAGSPRGEESDTASAACAAPSSPDGAPAGQFTCPECGLFIVYRGRRPKCDHVPPEPLGAPGKDTAPGYDKLIDAMERPRPRQRIEGDTT